MTSQGGSGGSPVGAAGGILGGTYPSPVAATDGTNALWSVLSNYLTANVTMTNANQFYDGPALALTAGTWLLFGQVYIHNGTGTPDIAAKLWDGTTVASSTGGSFPASGDDMPLILAGKATLVAPATWKISVANAVTSSTLSPTLFANAAGNTASYLLALKLP